MQNVSMEIPAGGRVAVIGGTGSGKTTLVRLLLGFYAPKCGEVLMDGKPITALTKGELRSAYSVALQKSMIFEGTVRDNITMGVEQAGEEEVLAAADACELSEFLASKKEGLDFLLTGSGQNVSGGQKQRINLARAVFRDASVYVFDDTFSALDYLTESNIRKKLALRLHGKTRLLITQRVSTAMSCDRIYVLDGGRIVGEGTHEELRRTCPVYAEICQSQLGRREKGGGEDA